MGAEGVFTVELALAVAARKGPKQTVIRGGYYEPTHDLKRDNSRESFET